MEKTILQRKLERGLIKAKRDFPHFFPKSINVYSYGPQSKYQRLIKQGALPIPRGVILSPFKHGFENRPKGQRLINKRLYNLRAIQAAGHVLEQGRPVETRTVVIRTRNLETGVSNGTFYNTIDAYDRATMYRNLRRIADKIGITEAGTQITFEELGKEYIIPFTWIPKNNKDLDRLFNFGWSWGANDQGLNIQSNWWVKMIENKVRKATLVYRRFAGVLPQYYNQVYQEGESNCVMMVIERVINNLNDTRNKKTLLKKVSLYKEKFKNGVYPEDFQTICNGLKIDIKLYNIAGKLYKEIFNEKGKSNRTIKMTNSRFNHVEDYINFKGPFQSVKRTELERIAKENFHIYIGGKCKSAILTSIGNYQVEADTQIEKLMTKVRPYGFEYGINPKDDFIIDFIHSSNHFVGAYTDDKRAKKITREWDYLEGEYREYEEEVGELPKLYEVDGEKMYPNFNQDKYYEGFPIISQYGETDKIEGVGFYKISAIKINSPWFKKLGILQEGGVYPSSVLKCVLGNNWASFKITFGAWGLNRLDWGDLLKPLIKDKSYSKAVGILSRMTKETVYNCRNDTKIAAMLKNDGINVGMWGKDILEFKIKKERVNSYSHFSSMILGSCLNLLMTELHKYNQNNVWKITIDSIITDDVKEMSFPFRIKNEDYINMSGMDTDFVSHYPEVELKFKGKAPDIDKLNTFIGAGGTGKTYTCRNMNIVGSVYCVDSNLQKSKQEHGFSYGRNLTQMLNKNFGRYKEPSVIIVDEVSKITLETMNDIIKKYPTSIIIFCGDIGYQLPPCYSGNEPKPIGRVRELTEVFRFLDDDIRTFCLKMREYMDKGAYKDFMKLYYTIPKSGLDNYKITDYVLCPTHRQINEVNKRITLNEKKWLITKNTKDYFNGQIIIGEKPDAPCELRYAFTGHQIQGDTIEKDMIYIDESYDMSWIYTAVCRARNFNQLRRLI